MSDDPEVERWTAAGYEALEAGDLERALEAAEALLALRHSSGFELAGLAHLQAGRVAPAIAVLERGVEQAGDVWLLWQLLGNARSDDGRFAEAQAAYERALRCPDADRASIDLNRCILLERQERFEEALAVLEAREAGPLAAQFAGPRATCLLRLGRPDEARDVLRAALEDGDGDAAEPGLRAALCAQLAEVQLELGQPWPAREAALEALAHERGNEHALWCLRELEGEAVAGARGFRLLLRGTWTAPLEEGEPAPGFYTSYTVVAADLEAALERALAFEPEALRGSLALEEHQEEEEVEAGLPTGVYRVGEYVFFEPDEGR